MSEKNSYKQKYLRYKKKYMILKNQIGAVNLNGTLHLKHHSLLLTITTRTCNVSLNI